MEGTSPDLRSEASEELSNGKLCNPDTKKLSVSIRWSLKNCIPATP